MNNKQFERLLELKRNYRYKYHKKYSNWEGPFFLKIIREQEKVISRLENTAYRLAAKLDRVLK